jgi:hypothetical protein
MVLRPFSQYRQRDVHRDAQAERRNPKETTQQIRQRPAKEDSLQLLEIWCPKARNGVPTGRRLSKPKRSSV